MGTKKETTKPAGKKGKKAAAVSTSEPVAPLSASPAEDKPAKKTLRKTTAKAANKPAFTTDDIALRAYFISEKRQKLGLPGDAHQDWLEAERQLLTESKKKPSKNG